MNNKKVLIGVVIAAFILLGGGFFVLSSNKSASSTEVTPAPIDEEEEVVPTIAPDDLGLVFESNGSASAPAVKFTINNPQGIDHIEYEISYNALVNGNTVPQGLNGEISKDQFGSNKIDIKFRELGTCSSGRCRYDQGVTSAKLILKITKSDGKIYQAEDTLEF